LNQTTNEYEEKFYKLVVSSGSSRAGILGEALINLGEFADFNHPAQRALPLKNCNSGTVLHVKKDYYPFCQLKTGNGCCRIL
jgi:hypothetical protein